MSSYDDYEVLDDQWFRVGQEGMRLCCCDCGLIHFVEFKGDETWMRDLKVVRE